MAKAKAANKSTEPDVTEDQARALAFNATVDGGMFFDGRTYRKATGEEAAAVEERRAYNKGAAKETAEAAGASTPDKLIQTANGGGAPTGDGGTPATGGGAAT